MPTRRDPLTPAARSETMRRIRSVNTKPELALRKELYRRGLRYRVDYQRAPGRPDIAMVGRKLAIFVDGEFWHGKKLSPERLAEMSEYWQTKIRRNVERDLRVNKELQNLQWTVIRVSDKAITRDLLSVSEFIENIALCRLAGVCPSGLEVVRPDK